jgi:hypothetical protein
VKQLLTRWQTRTERSWTEPDPIEPTMNILPLPVVRTRAAEPARLGVAADVSGLALLMVLTGLVALAGSVVLPAAGLPALQGRFAGLACLLIVVGAGLWQRMNWARCAASGMFAYAIYAQLTSRWLESDVLRLFIDSLRGVHDTNLLALDPLPAGAMAVLPPASASAAGLGLALCLALAWFLGRLLSAPVRAEFGR